MTKLSDKDIKKIRKEAQTLLLGRYEIDGDEIFIANHFSTTIESTELILYSKFDILSK